MPQFKPSRISLTPANHDEEGDGEKGEEAEFPRFKKPVGALAEASEKLAAPGGSAPRRRSGRFLLGFMAGVLAAGFGTAAVFLLLIRNDLGSFMSAPQPPRREAKVVKPETLGAPLPLELPNAVNTEPEPAAPPKPTDDTAPPTTPVPAALSDARLFVHHSATPSQASVAADIAGQLRGGGLTVIDIRPIQGTVSAGSVRYFFPADRNAASGLADMLGRLYRERNDPRGFRLLDFTHYNPKPRERTLEIWLPG
jgi:hypothetical protein